MSSYSTSPELSVVIPARNEATHLPGTVASLQATLPPGSEMLVIDDGSTDGGADGLPQGRSIVRCFRTDGIGAAQARNYGARRARGEVIVFADAHIKAPPGWWEPMLVLLDNPSVGAVGPAVSVMGRRGVKGFGLRVCGPVLRSEWLRQRGRTPYVVPMLGGFFLAMRRDTFKATGGYDGGLLRWGANDLELSLRLWLLGYSLWLVPGVEVAHLFRKKHPYAVDGATVVHNLLRTALLHFTPSRLARVVEALKAHPAFAAAFSRCVESDVWQRRAQLAACHVYKDDWFFNRFGLTC